MSPAETTIVMIIGIVVVALVIRWFSRDERSSTEKQPVDQVEALLAEVSGVDAGKMEGVVAVTSQGWAFVPDGGEVQLIPPDTNEEDVPIRSPDVTGYGPQTDPDIQMLGGRGGPVHPRTHRPVASWKVGVRIDHGDLVGVRVKRGAPDHDPWRLEAIGRDGDYRAWFFETEEAARAAMKLLERVVRPPRDEDGQPQPPEPEDFDEARRQDEETERALEHEDRE